LLKWIHLFFFFFLLLLFFLFLFFLLLFLLLLFRRLLFFFLFLDVLRRYQRFIQVLFDGLLTVGSVGLARFLARSLTEPLGKAGCCVIISELVHATPLPLAKKFILIFLNWELWI
jgi:hypothetical protein